MSLTVKDFTIRDCTCPACRRPAKVYGRKGHHYLRCTWADCPTNRNMCVPSIETFYRVIEENEKRDLSADHEAGREPGIVSAGRPQRVRTRNRITRAIEREVKLSTSPPCTVPSKARKRRTEEAAKAV